MTVSRVRRGTLLAGALGCVLLAGCGPSSATPRVAQPQAPAARAQALAAVPGDWRDATYRVTCDGLLLGAVRATLHDGAATVPVDVSESPYYDDVELRLQATATGDLDGDGRPDTVVLLQCSPQPSNGSAQEVHVFRADGSELAVLPSPGSLDETTILAPVYDPAGLAVEDRTIVASMKAYGPGDSHATGPSQPFTVRWQWTGAGFTRVP